MMLSELIVKVTALRNATVQVPQSLMGVANEVTSKAVAPNIVTSVSNKIGGVDVLVSPVDGASVNQSALKGFGHHIAMELAVEGKRFSSNFVKDNYS